MKHILCMFSRHKFTEWSYLSSESCTQARRCERCGQGEQQNLLHNFGAWEYVADGSCEQVRSCTRCGGKAYRTALHNFRPWEFIAEGSCAQVRVCAQCGKKEERIEHNWTDAQDQHDCCYRRTCARDGAIDECPHDWVFEGEGNETVRTDYQGEVEWHLSQSVNYYRCSHCAESYSSTTGEAGWIESYKL